MKITDNLGRSVDVALVAKPPLSAKFSAGLEWTRPHFYEIANNNKLFVRMPVGQFALRVMSQHKTEVLMHVDGKLRARTVVPSGLQYVDKDDAGNFYIFAAPGEEKPFIPASDQVLMEQPEAPTSEATQPALFEAGDADVQMPMLPVSDPGAVHVVLRFVDEPGPGLKPPAQEFEVVFQMNTPSDHDNLVAEKHLLTMVKPKPLINHEDETSFEPPQGHLPTFTCTCTGCVRDGR
ncbi:MAG: hypothetical protein JSS83_17035 [Cyanobacteria bacterium SZAS LIN-3]|nr:hypothetical protein [Cyanobacteria bacterium SZAS LIN-3]MBS2010723.1 hypothetical protein [Cyanobacteria bacterium SZAS TMP-1]